MRFADGAIILADERKGADMPQPMKRKPAEESASRFPVKEDRPRWIVEIDEGPAGEDWQLEIDSPEIYLSCQVSDRTVLERAITLLDSSLTVRMPKKQKFTRKRDEVSLGRFNGNAVQLLRDDEDFIRCFIVIGQQARSTMRISLDEARIQAFLEALRKALEGSHGRNGHK
jgi:hypothetical protein